jgi:hypothetical protein
MGAYTETYIRIDKLSPEQREEIAKNALWHVEHHAVYYINYKEKGWDYALEDWLEMHKENYEYFVRECDVDPDKMTEEYLKRDLRKRIRKCKKIEKDIREVIDGKKTLEEFITDNHLCKRWGSIISVMKYDGQLFVRSNEEIFRNYEYDQLSINLHTVEDLIAHLKNPELKSIKDLTVDDSNYEPLTPELENKIRSYYGKIGDNNFLVNFG